MKRNVFLLPYFMAKVPIYFCIVFFSLCCTFVQAQVPFFQKCTGEGENNLANFTIQNTLPEKGVGCEVLDKCNPYFLNTLDTKGECLRHTWLINNVEQKLENPIAFCNAFELGQEQIVTHIVSILEGKETTEYRATCAFTPVNCCDIAFDVKLKALKVIEESKEGKVCVVVVAEELSGIQLSSYTVETLNGIIYEGKEPQNEYQAPCGNLGDMLCFTAKGDGEDCEKEICILLDKLEGSKPENKVIANHDEPITINCYPNPTKDILYVGTNISNDATGQLLISNLYGIPIYRQKIGVGQSQQEIDTSTFGSGNYLLTVTDSKGCFAVQKFVILK